jgi:hypothetical protein
MSISNYAEAAILNAIFNNVALQKANRYVKLHTGDPGEDCTANAATETTRKSLTGAAAVSGAGTFTSVNDLIWTNVAATEAYTFVSIWDDPTAGNALWSGSLTANPVTAGDTFTIPTGSLVVTLS